MKTIITRIFFLAAIVFFAGCEDILKPGGGGKNDVLVQGQVLEQTKREPIANAEVIVNYVVERETRQEIGYTDGEGLFKLVVPASTSYVINTMKDGYGFASKNFQDEKPIPELPFQTFYLRKATVVTIDPEKGGTITVENTESAGTTSSKAKWDNSPTGYLPIVLDDSGRASSFIMPDKLKSAWDVQVKNSGRLSATRLTIRPNTLVNASGAPARGQVSVAVSAVDVFTPNGMPGNNIARTAQGQTGPMQSFGAVVVEVFDKEGEYNLDQKNEAAAEIVMPVPDWQLRMGKERPRSVPILFYNEESGEWEEDGVARYSEEQRAYVGEVRHFSSINFDVIKTGPSANAAFTFNITTPTAQPNELGIPFLVEVTTEDAADNQLYVRTRTIDATNGGNPLCNLGSTALPGGNTQTTYGISMNRLPINSPVAATFFSDPSNPEARALYIFRTNGGSQDITDDPWGSPDCAEIETNVYSDSKFVNPSQFIDQTTGMASDTLVAMCIQGSNFRVSVASKDLTFDATSGTVLRFIEPVFPGDPPGCDLTFIMSDPGSPFTELFKTAAGPPADPEWMVQVFDIPISDLCNDATIGNYNVEVSDVASLGVVKANLNVEVGDCIF